MAKVRTAALTAGLVASLAGCSFAPPYHPPAAPPVVAFKEAGPWQAAAPADRDPHQPWWSVFADPDLDRLEHKLDGDNPTLAAALGRYDAARGYLAEAHAAQLPTIGLETDITQNRQSDNRPLRGSGQPDLYAADTVGGALSFDLDLWGALRNKVAAGRAEAQASADDAAAIKLSLEAQLANAYVTLRGYDAQKRLLTAT